MEKPIWEFLKLILERGINYEEGQISLFDSINSLIENMSILCDESIIENSFNYVLKNVKNKTPTKICSSIYSFGCILRTIHQKKMIEIIPKSIVLLCDLFKLKNEDINLALSWCLEKICLLYPYIILQNKKIFSLLMRKILDLIIEKNHRNEFIRKLCHTTFFLISYKNKNDLPFEVNLSPYIEELFEKVFLLGFLPKSFEKDSNVSEICFQIILELFEIIKENDTYLLTYIFEKICIYSEIVSKGNDNPEKNEFYQNNICLLLQKYCKIEFIKNIEINEEIVAILFRYIEIFFKARKKIFNEGILAMSGLLVLIPEKKLGNFLKKIMNYIDIILKRKEENEGYEAVTICILNILKISKKKWTGLCK